MQITASTAQACWTWLKRRSLRSQRASAIEGAGGVHRAGFLTLLPGADASDRWRHLERDLAGGRPDVNLTRYAYQMVTTVPRKTMSYNHPPRRRST